MDPSYYIGSHQPIADGWAQIWSSDKVNIVSNIIVNDNLDISPYYVNQEQWQQLKQLQDQNYQLENQYYYQFKAKNSNTKVSRRNFNDEVSPAGRIGHSIFVDRAGLKLANIDRVFNITRSRVSYLNQHDYDFFSYADLCGGPGAFTQYIQYRRPRSFGFGITLKGNDSTDWHLDSNESDQSRFKFIFGKDNTGNIITNAEEVVNTILQQMTHASDGPALSAEIPIAGSKVGVDAVVADGWIGPTMEATYKLGNKTITDKDNYYYEESINFDLIAIELIVGIRVLRVGGNLVCKVTDTVTKRMVQLLYLVSQCFEAFTLFKPISSRAGNGEKYIIGLGKRDNIDSIVNILINLQNLITNKQTIVNIVNVDTDFVNYLVNLNNLFLSYLYKYTIKINNLIVNSINQINGTNLYNTIDIDNLDLDRIYTSWRLPGVYGTDYHPNLNSNNISQKRIFTYGK